eukprot:364595-Chlamydomonas_euryale.AAC.18
MCRLTGPFAHAHACRSRGGTVFTASNARQVPDPSKAFAICPAGLPDEPRQLLEKTFEDFRYAKALHSGMRHPPQHSSHRKICCGADGGRGAI